MKQLLFLDILSTRSDKLITSVFRRSTFTGLLQNCKVFTCKKDLIETLIDRTFRSNNTWDNFQLDPEKLKVIFQKKNEYSPKLIDKSVSKYLSKKIKNIHSKIKY